MTAVISKNPRKSEFIRILNSQKEYFRHYFREEETLNFIFDRFVEIMFNLETNTKETEMEKISTGFIVDKHMRKIKDRAFRTIMFHKGSLL